MKFFRAQHVTSPGDTGVVRSGQAAVLGLYLDLSLMAGLLLFVVGASSYYHPALAPHFAGWTRQGQPAEQPEVTRKGSWLNRGIQFSSRNLGPRS